MTATEALWKGTVRAVEDAEDAWKREEEAAARAQGAEDILRGSLAMLHFARRDIALQWDALFSGRIRDVQDTRERLQRMAARTISLAEEARKLVGISETDGYSFTQLPELAAALAELVRLRDDLARRWPRFDPDALERGLAQAARGEAADLAEVYQEFPELQGKRGHSDTCLVAAKEGDTPPINGP